ncbi:unnamed protein product, partial [Musa hybrid cultivar]
ILAHLNPLSRSRDTNKGRSRCKSLSKLSLERRSPLRLNPLTPLTMSRPRSR